MTDSEVERIIESTLSKKRFLHTLGCAETARCLAAHWGEDENDAYRAALLHDVAKEMPYDAQLKLLNDNGIILSETQRLRDIIHAFSGAVIAKLKFGEPERICSAVRWHTTARAGMPLLEKIICLADLTEPGRSFPGVEEIRRLSFESLSRALVLGFDTTISVLVKKGRQIDINTIEARNYELLEKD